MYKVITAFSDLTDTVTTKSGQVCYVYEVGDTYPRRGVKPTAERIKELSGKENKRGVPLIKEIKKGANKASK